MLAGLARSRGDGEHARMDVTRSGGASGVGPLAGLRVIELAGIGPAPFGAMVLADLGADVLRVERPDAVGAGEVNPTDILQRNKRSIGLDLKHPAGAAFLLELVERADVLLEGFRPGVTERLGVGPEVCRERNGRLVYGRMTGWGQEGPLAQAAGHDIDYIALAGVLDGFGRAGEAPVPPCNLVGDFGGGGMLLAIGVLAALFARQEIGRGQVVDAAMVDGAALLATMLWSFKASGFWRSERGTNLLDTGAPYYEVYECADGRHVAVGALEPQFHAALCRVMGLDETELPAQMDRASWPATKRRFAEVFSKRSRDEWVALAAKEGGDACLTPVLSMDEAPGHPHNLARRSFIQVEGVTQPAPAPRFSLTPAGEPRPPRAPGGNGREALEEWGIGEESRRSAEASGVLRLA